MEQGIAEKIVDVVTDEDDPNAYQRGLPVVSFRYDLIAEGNVMNSNSVYITQDSPTISNGNTHMYNRCGYKPCFVGKVGSCQIMVPLRRKKIPKCFVL